MNAKVVILVVLHVQGHLQIVPLALALTISNQVAILVYWIIVHLAMKNKHLVTLVLFVLLELLELIVLLVQQVVLRVMLQVLPHVLLVLEAILN